MIARARRALPFLIAVLATIVAVGLEPVLVVCAAGGVLSVFLPWRARSSRIAELVVFILAIAIGRAIAQTEPWDEVPGSFFVLAVLGSVLVRLFLVSPIVGRRLDIGLLLALFVPLAYLLSRRSFVALVLPFTVTSLLTRDDDDAPAALWRSPWSTALVAGLTGTITLLGAFGLPILDKITNRRIATMIGSRSGRSAFTGRVQLESATQIYRSDTLVLRIHPPQGGLARPDYLRGRVFDVFDGAVWSTSRDRLRDRRNVQSRDPGPSSTRIESDAASHWLFAPQRAVVDTRAGRTIVLDGFAVAQLGRSETVTEWSFAPDETSVPAPPTESDLRVPKALEPRLRALAEEWTRSATGNRERLAAIERHLQEYRYTLDRTHRSTVADSAPLMDFLFVHKAGHCEFIATAMAMLARSIGIPARLVSGYRVVEQNAVGHYWVVREKHAHAWVEAWDGERFRTVDATPALLNLDEHETPRTSATYDYARSLVVRALREFARSPEKALLGLSAVLVAIVLVRALRKRLGRRRALSRGAEDSRPPAFYVALAQALAKARLPRAPSETLEDYADRLEATGGLADAATAIRAYARHRYGSAPRGSLETDCATVASRLVAVHGRPSLAPR